MDTLNLMFGVGAMGAGVICFICGWMLGADATVKRIMKGAKREAGILG